MGYPAVRDGAAPGLICFDLDGTLYRDSVIYPRIIDHFFAGTAYETWSPAVKARMEQVLWGELPLRCGHFVPKTAAHQPQCPEALFEVPSVPALLLEDPGPYLDRSAYSYIGDGWTLAMYLARRAGWSGDAFWARFLAARRDLVSAEYGPRPDRELIELLARLRARGIVLVLCSNARQGPGEDLLAHLGLEHSFDEISFDADKPHSFPLRIARWSAGYRIAPREMLFVGDQGYHDLYEGRRNGARTLLLSPYPAADACLWDHRVDTTEALKQALGVYAGV